METYNDELMGSMKISRAVAKMAVPSVISSLVTAFIFFREPVIRLFINDDEVVRYGVQMLTAYMLSGPFIGILFVNMNCMQSVGHPFPATMLSVLRQGVLLIPLLFLLRSKILCYD